MDDKKKKELESVLGSYRIVSNTEKHNRNKNKRPVSSLKKTTSNHVEQKKNINKKMFYKQCGKKVRYPSQSSASGVIRHALKERGVHLRCYYCEICSGYHLTKKV